MNPWLHSCIILKQQTLSQQPHAGGTDLSVSLTSTEPACVQCCLLAAARPTRREAAIPTNMIDEACQVFHSTHSNEPMRVVHPCSSNTPVPDGCLPTTDVSLHNSTKATHYTGTGSVLSSAAEHRNKLTPYPVQTAHPMPSAWAERFKNKAATDNSLSSSPSKVACLENGCSAQSLSSSQHQQAAAASSSQQQCTAQTGRGYLHCLHCRH